MAKQSGLRRRTARDSDDDAVDSFDVPAAVLCAFCGGADCAGCTGSDTTSGVVAIIPWERTNAGVWSRLWATANATTQGAESFFALLPDGEIRSAMRFAVLAELLAVVSIVALFGALLALALPGLALAVWRDPALRVGALRWIALGVPALALWMVLAHVTHGAALDVGARRQGASPQRRRALRFGLYACGWDLMTGPIGAVIVLCTRGFGAALSLAELAMNVPGRATVALLRGAYQLSPDELVRARRSGTVAALLIAVVSAAVILTLAWVAVFT